MTTKRSAALHVLALGAAGLLAGGSALASSETRTAWTRVTPATGDSNDEVGHARTTTGVLHVVWRRRVGPNREEIAHTTVSPAGKPGATTVAATPFVLVTDPDLVVMPDGSLRVFFGAQTGITESSGVRTATATAGGSGWSLDPERVSASTVTPSDVGAAVSAGGVPIVSWIAGPVLSLHTGLSPADPDRALGPSPKCCFNRPALVTAGGQTLLAFHSNVAGQEGIFVRPVAPTLGPAHRAPGSTTGGQTVAVDERTPVTARSGAAGVYAAYCGGYPECHTVLLWRVGSAKARTVGEGRDVENVNVAPGPDGRLWVMWEDNDANALLARRSDPSVGCMGAIVAVDQPPRSSYVWALNGEGSLGPLDVFANAAPTRVGSAATWHTRILPGLALVATGGKTLTFTVTDACQPVAGARIAVGGRKLATNAKGVATVTLPAGSYSAVATKLGFTSASARVKSA